jgi:hypothetical protein
MPGATLDAVGILLWPISGIAPQDSKSPLQSEAS